MPLDIELVIKARPCKHWCFAPWKTGKRWCEKRGTCKTSRVKDCFDGRLRRTWPALCFQLQVQGILCVTSFRDLKISSPRSRARRYCLRLYTFEGNACFFICLATKAAKQQHLEVGSFLKLYISSLIKKVLDHPTIHPIMFLPTWKSSLPWKEEVPFVRCV